MNNTRRKSLEEIRDKLEDIKSDIELYTPLAEYSRQYGVAVKKVVEVTA